MTTPKVVIYGASGYTGKHLAWKLSQRGIPFIAAGRNKQRLEIQLKSMPELNGARYEVVAVEHNVAALKKLLDGMTVVYNLVGPYMQLGKPVVDAALAARCHYVDCAGEQDWMFRLKNEYAQRFADSDLCLLPATAALWNFGMLAAELVLEKSGIDSLDIAYTLTGVPSAASMQSYLQTACKPQYFLKGNQREAWPMEGIQIAVPGVHEVQLALPWSGGGEAVWYEGHERVHSCMTLVAFRNNTLIKQIIRRGQEFAHNFADKSREEQQVVMDQWATEMASSENPQREDLDLHRGWITCHGRAQTVARSVGLPGVAVGYLGTGAMSAFVIDALLRSQQKAAGFIPAIHVVGVRAMLAELQAHGILGDPVDIIL
ncbi:DUF5938 domain-containing protein [Cupriavidus sp. CuC1]|uniref:DUF5938 domain-containing protein n=1 Tax=Cupriavidus sp. CuC1 TaxID=3373131 RepID=UPI0037D7CE89